MSLKDYIRSCLLRLSAATEIGVADKGSFSPCHRKSSQGGPVLALLQSGLGVSAGKQLDCLFDDLAARLPSLMSWLRIKPPTNGNLKQTPYLLSHSLSLREHAKTRVIWNFYSTQKQNSNQEAVQEVARLHKSLWNLWKLKCCSIHYTHAKKHTRF